MAAVTDPILLDSTGQEIVEALEAIAENMGTSAGHTIQNDSGTDMQRRDKLQFKGVYVEDDQANDVTKVDICRTMTKAQMEALSGESLKGFINTSDEPDSLPLTAEWVAYDSNTSVKDKIDSMETATEGTATFNPELDWGTGGYVAWVKRGKLVFVTYSFTLNSNPSNTAVLFTGLPPMKLVTGAYNWVTFQNMSNGLSERASLSANGTISNTYGFFVRTGDHNGSFCYIAQ